jgi:hypothetical protein
MSERVQSFPRVSSHGSRVRWAAVVAVSVLVAFIAWMLFKGGGNEAKAPNRANAVAASVTQLAALPRKVGHAVYWAGAETGMTYELTQTSRGNVFVRYLPAGVELNDPRPNFLTIGTYPRRDAYEVLQRFSRQPRAVNRQLARGGLAVYSQDRPNSIYVAYPGQDLQVEVYDPSASQALRFVTSGKLRPIG